MKSMTDFIDSINVADMPSVYNEDYSWAEEYSGYFNEESDNYIQPILESSGYQFFGEAAFYQEAHKGLLAGGILALFSGAFLMIMKLLKGDRGSNGSNSGSSQSTKSTKNKTNSNEPETEESIVFNAKTIIDELHKLRKKGYTRLTKDLSWGSLVCIDTGLSDVLDVVEYMVGLVKDGIWDVFGSSKTDKSMAATIFIFNEKCEKLHDSVVKIKEHSTNPTGYFNDKISDIIDEITSINKLARSIEEKCKEGMKLCREERAKRQAVNNDFSNVDKAYKIFNDIIRDVNVVCKNIQQAYAKVHGVYDNAEKGPETDAEVYFRSVMKNIDALEKNLDAHDFTRFKTECEKIKAKIDAHEYDAEKIMNNLHSIIEKYVYGSDTKLDSDNWKEVEKWLSEHEYYANAYEPGHHLFKSDIRNFKQLIPAPTDNPSDDGVIKTIIQQPRTLSIYIDDKKKEFLLAGKCTYWKGVK
jgi:hypothetical protein